MRRAVIDALMYGVAIAVVAVVLPVAIGLGFLVYIFEDIRASGYRS